jgi:peptidoglycan-associated lipoprotein
MRKLIFAAFVAALVAGCQTQPTQAPAPTGDSSASASATTPGAGASTAGSSQSGISGTTAPGSLAGRDPLRDPSSPLSKRSVYFDFDSFTVKDEYRPLVEAHARYLQSNRNAHLTIQGNADERGSREYNIALGQKRAEAVKRMMQVLGVQDNQVETVSFGEEKPKAVGHDESAWAQNRRDDIVYAGE